MDRAEAERRVKAARVARLGTIGRGGQVDLVPCTFAVDGDRLVTAVDHKPKSTLDLQRLRNVRADPRVALLIDEYEDDWSRLWWVRLRGVAEVFDGGPEREQAIGLLVAKYAQYEARVPAGAAIVVTVGEWRWWSAG